jgi:hypothetical protein
MSNPFLNFEGESEEAQRHNARNERQEAKAARQPMVLRGLEKDQAEKAKQMKRYRKWKAEVRDGISRGDYGTEIISLFKYLKKPTIAAGLLDYIRDAAWLHACSFDVRLTLLGYIDASICRHNIRSGRSVMDDPIPSFNGGTDEPPTDGFIEIRHMLVGV